MDLAVGPVRIDVVEPLHKLRVIVDAPDHGISADIVFTGRSAPIEEPRFIRRIGPRTLMDYTRLTQNGHYRGWIEVAGSRRVVSEETWLGQRDHSWGIRAEMRTDESNPPLTFYPPFFYCWTTAQFKNRGLHIFFKERAPGD